MSALQVIWFFLVGVLFTGYAILDGFDLGTGYWFLRDKKPQHRTRMLAAIGPVWDGNEVWLLTGGGALFAAFPMVYASVFSGMYLPLILVLMGLIFRAVSIEFFGQHDDARWRAGWGWAFGLGSLLPALLLGVALGNVVVGMELRANGDYVGGFWGLLNPYSLFAGLYSLTAFVVHGGLYQLVKSDGEMADGIKAHLGLWWKIYLALFLLVGPLTAIFALHMFKNFMLFPMFFFVPAAILGSIVMIWVYLRQGRHGMAFVASAVSIASVILTVGIMSFPVFVHATDPALSLTAGNSSSGPLTLGVMLIIALIGMPLVLGYTVWVYRTFAGKTTEDEKY